MYEYVFDVASVADVRTNLLLRVLSHSNNVRNIGIPYHPILRAPSQASLRISARRASDEMVQALKEEELSEQLGDQLGAIAEDF